MSGVSFWAFIGTLYLIILTVQDIKYKGYVDDRKNYFLMGVTISLLTHFNKTLWFIGVIILISITMSILLSRYVNMGEADINTVMWLFIGYAIINLYYLLLFVIVFGLINVLFWVLHAIIARIMKIDRKKPVPYYIVFLLSFLSVNIILGLY